MKHHNKGFLFAFIIAIMVLSGCNPETIPLKGKYETSPIEFTSTKSADTLWNNIAQTFAAKGLTIKTIDKGKGLIVTKKTSFIPVYTFEDKDGKLNEPQAWVVMEKVIIKEKQWSPETIYGRWSIQVTETRMGATKIWIDPVVICTYSPNMFMRVEIRGQSTGKLEELIKRTLD